MNSYGGTNFVHFCEIAKEDLGYSISGTTLNNWLREEVISPKAKRKTKSNMKKLLKAKLNSTKSQKVKNAIKESISIIDSKDTHPTRSRCKYMGEMIQMDAPSFHWIPSVVWHLHLL